ncbi:zinc-binding dehydrogenase [Colletotrichum karsti]|uniref:Zinc-binding dehydrogenase n=1 Tax=Colletotrichum karsti TaxID=1095194 RepID=A0A9P6LDI7_9PEZI|nr:zinc-binding dehydrogenase [Colletotrichum karsti]KAF9871814.1 zinc-binding dehydrogenase [Colletotrichum karsti]
MSEKNNRAAWLTGPKIHPFKIDDAPFPQARPGEVVIKNVATALNPAEWKIQDYGVIVQKYPTILGADAAGYIEEVGEGVTHLEKGQRVIGYCTGLGLQNPEFATFQLYSKASANLVSAIPDDISFERASVLPLAIATASVGLYKKKYLGLPLPSLKPTPSGKTLLVWGGASSVGGTAVQLAAASGLRVISTASRVNFDKVKALGADTVLDYHSENVVADAVAVLAGTEVAGVYDAISSPESLKPIGAILDKLGPHKVITVLPSEGDYGKNALMSFETAFQITEDPEEVGDPIWRDFVPAALKSGQLQPKPDAEVVGKGLESIQAGLERLKKGVSATKLVIQY